jgi:hypothetical protein
MKRRGSECIGNKTRKKKRMRMFRKSERDM